MGTKASENTNTLFADELRLVISGATKSKITKQNAGYRQSINKFEK